MFFFFFFFFEKKVRKFYWIKSDWNTLSKSLGRDSTHTSMSADITALLAKACANLFPSLLTWLNLQERNDAPRLLHTSITWPNKVLQLLAMFRAARTLEQSPSISTSNKLSSLANDRARRVAIAFASSTDWTKGIFWLKAAITWPWKSLGLVLNLDR